MSKTSKIEAEIAEYEALLKDSSVPQDEKDFAREEIADLKRQLNADYAKAVKNKDEKKINEIVTRGSKKKAKSKKEKKPAKPANEYKYKGKSIKELSELECTELLAEIKARREKATKSSEKSKSKPVIEKVAANVAKAVKQAVENVPAKDIDKTEIAKFKRIEKAAEAFVKEMKSILGSDWDKEAVQDEFAQITKLIESLRKKYASGTPKAAKGMKVEKTKNDYEEHLNESGTPEHEHPENDGRVSWGMVDSYGTWLRKNDPIAFNVGYNEWK